jgi:hypothetical protein
METIENFLLYAVVIIIVVGFLLFSLLIRLLKKSVKPWSIARLLKEKESILKEMLKSQNELAKWSEIPSLTFRFGDYSWSANRVKTHQNSYNMLDSSGMSTLVVRKVNHAHKKGGYLLAVTSDFSVVIDYSDTADSKRVFVEFNKEPIGSIISSNFKVLDNNSEQIGYLEQSKGETYILYLNDRKTALFQKPTEREKNQLVLLELINYDLTGVERSWLNAFIIIEATEFFKAPEQEAYVEDNTDWKDGCLSFPRIDITFLMPSFQSDSDD